MRKQIFDFIGHLARKLYLQDSFRKPAYGRRRVRSAAIDGSAGVAGSTACPLHPAAVSKRSRSFIEPDYRALEYSRLWRESVSAPCSSDQSPI
jgi:hypothetical protein